MARYRSFRKGNYRRPRKAYRPRGITYSQIGSKVLSDIKMLKDLINVEHKDVTTQITNSLVTQTPSSFLLNGIAVGTDRNNRNGRSVKSSSVSMKLMFTQDVTAVDTFVRCIIVLDKQCNGAGFTGADLLTQNIVSSHYNIDNGKRFVVLHDHVMQFNSNGRSTQMDHMYKKLNFHVKFDGTTSTIADITSNSLYLFLLSNETTAAPSVTGEVRYRFIDN